MADIVLLFAGAGILIGVCVTLTVRRSWLAALRVPASPEHCLDRFDVVVAAWVFLFASYIGILLAGFITGSAATGATSQPAAGELTPAMIIGQTAGGTLTAVILALIARRRFKAGLSGWGLSLRGIGRNLVIAILVTLAVLPVCYGLLLLFELLIVRVTHEAPAEHGSILLLLDANKAAWMKALTVINALVVAPVAEEMLFRGILLRAIERWTRSPYWGLVLSSVLFGLIHMSVLKTVPALIVFGLALGATYLKTRSLTAAILVHSLFNAKTILWLLLGIGVVGGG